MSGIESNSEDALLSSYNYELNNRLIAQVPVEPRHSARMMVVKEALKDSLNVKHLKVWDLKDELQPCDLLVLNNTRVMKARIKVRFRGGGLAELLLLEPHGEGLWLCLGRPAKRMREGDSLWLESSEHKPIELKVKGKDLLTGGRLIKFPSRYAGRQDMNQLLARIGEVPLPPYIQKEHFQNHEDRYQTKFALHPGAVAAPTAGLHLSDLLLDELKRRGIQFAQVTLHVGIGTFKPLEVEALTGLKLHHEWVDVDEKVLKAVKTCKSRGGRVFAVGTTSVRALEAAYLLGGGELQPFSGDVDLVIQPGFKFGVIDGLLTNFHLPKSSLLLLVSALIGRKRLLELYQNAINSEYRFFSYGDAMLITPESVLKSATVKSSKVG